MGLYEANHKILFSGDHLLKGISPVILTEYADQHFLKTYYRDLDRVSELKPEYLFPAHGAYLTCNVDIEAAISDTHTSYNHLCETTLLILAQSPRPMSAYQVTLKIYGLSRTEMRKALGLRHFLMTQKILSCLEYLHEEGRLARTISNSGTLLYHPNNN